MHAAYASALDPYFGGDMEASIALSGQVAGRIESVKPVADVISETMAGFFDTINDLAGQYCSNGNTVVPS